jgi:hypothetical protein
LGLVVLVLLAVAMLQVQAMRVTITLALVAMRVAVTPAAMRLNTGQSKIKSTKVMSVMRKVLIALLVSMVFIWLGAFSVWGSTQVPPAIAQGQNSEELDFDWLQENVEAELSCDEFPQCLHIEVLASSGCLANLAVDLRVETSSGQWLADEYMVVPSPRFAGGFVIEVGTNRINDDNRLAIYSVRCSANLNTGMSFV